ncbi:MAG: protein-export chaperone SecB, partial [Pseudomonadota bacterium]
SEHDPLLREISLTLKLIGSADHKEMLLCELIYNAMVKIFVEDKQHVTIITMIEAPSLIFPTARMLVRNLINASGFSGVIIQPVNFADAFRNNLEQIKNKQDSLN